MTTVQEKDVVGDRRSVMQQARLAILDIYDAIVELVTNADDRYQLLDIDGVIEIEIKRGGSKSPKLIRVRDEADGMTLEVMDKKLSRTGGRVSGMEYGQEVRGTNSRGAKDIAALGKVSFKSISAVDGKYHECEISDGFKFRPGVSSKVTKDLRKSTGIKGKSGTVVTVELASRVVIQRKDNLLNKIQQSVALRDILNDPRRRIILRDSGQKNRIVLTGPKIDGKDRIKDTFEIPGYPGVTAKLVVRRASVPFDNEKHRFRQGGILVKSRHAIHEATYFDPELERNPHAHWFYGKLVCSHIDDLWNEYDNRFEAGIEPEPENSIPIFDPSRRTGLTREHPFVQELFRQALKRFRPLVDEERQREESDRAKIESEATRRRLNALEKAAGKFMQEYGEDESAARDPDTRQTGSLFKTKGVMLNPPFSQMVKGHSQKFWLTVNQEVFPEFEVGATVQIECLSSDVTSDKRLAVLKPHPAQEGALRALWTIKAVEATPATGVRAKVGSIVAESSIEVFDSEADKYKDVTTLCFARKRYRLYTDGKKKRVRVLAPLSMVSSVQQLSVSLSNRHFEVSGSIQIVPINRLGVAIAEFLLRSDGTEAHGVVTASLRNVETSAELQSIPSAGAGLKIELEDIDLKNQRYRWRQNVLEIAARHLSLARYLGSKAEGFPGQESKHFRLLLAEIVAEAVCAKLLAQNIQANPEDYEEADWDQYYADYSRLMAEFLPTAHKLQCPESG